MAGGARVHSVRVDRRAVEVFVRTDPRIQADMERRAKRVERYQRSTVPIDTGNLHDHIGTRKTPDGGREIGVFDTPGLPPADYVESIEFGWVTPSGRRVPAQPFIRPSTDAAR